MAWSRHVQRLIVARRRRPPLANATKSSCCAGTLPARRLPLRLAAAGPSDGSHRTRYREKSSQPAAAGAQRSGWQEEARRPRLIREPDRVPLRHNVRKAGQERLTWQSRLKRVFRIDIGICKRCMERVPESGRRDPPGQCFLRLEHKPRPKREQRRVCACTRPWAPRDYRSPTIREPALAHASTLLACTTVASGVLVSRRVPRTSPSSVIGRIVAPGTLPKTSICYDRMRPTAARLMLNSVGSTDPRGFKSGRRYNRQC